MKSIEFRGKSLEEAVLKACGELGKKKKELQYKILSNGSEGFFGIIGKKEAVIEVTEDEKPVATASSLVAEAFDDFDFDSDKNKDTIKETKQKKESYSDTFDNQSDNNKIVAPEDYEEVAKKGEAILFRLARFILNDDIDISIESKIKQKDVLLYKISSKDKIGVLIGKRGDTLRAIQYIVSKVVGKESGRKIKTQIDIEDYLQNKKREIESTALNLAQKVKKTGNSEKMERMSAADRKTVHMVLSKMEGVSTHSIGFGPYRKLIISSSNNNRK